MTVRSDLSSTRNLSSILTQIFFLLHLDFLTGIIVQNLSPQPASSLVLVLFFLIPLCIFAYNARKLRSSRVPTDCTSFIFISLNRKCYALFFLIVTRKSVNFMLQSESAVFVLLDCLCLFFLPEVFLIMSGHGHGHSHSCGCEGEHEPSERGFEYGLYSRIDLDKLQCLNESRDGDGKLVFKPWDRRNERDKVMVSPPVYLSCFPPWTWTP